MGMEWGLDWIEISEWRYGEYGDVGYREHGNGMGILI